MEIPSSVACDINTIFTFSVDADDGTVDVQDGFLIPVDCKRLTESQDHVAVAERYCLLWQTLVRGHSSPQHGIL
jgi:hypothetical protein